MGINASIDYIESENKKINWDSFESFKESTYWSIGEMSEEEIKRLKNLFESEEFRKKPQKPTYWAMISWSK